MDIYKLIDERLELIDDLFIKGKDDLNYVERVLDTKSNETGLIFPRGRIDSIRHDSLFIKELISVDWFISGIFELSALLSPSSSIEFNLYWLTKNKPKHIMFSKYGEKETYSSKFRKTDNISSIIKNREISKSYKMYLDNINLTLNSKDVVNIESFKRSGCFFNLPFAELNFDNLSINYYLPETVENRLKLQDEVTKPLGDLADVLLPRKIKDSLGTVCKKISNINDSGSYIMDTITNVKIQQGDILLSRSKSSNLFLVENHIDKDVYASQTTVVIRSTSDEVNPEYLLLYLASDTTQKYFHQFDSSSSTLSLLKKKHIKELPIIIPNHNVLGRAPKLYQSLYNTEAPNRIDVINEQLFNATDTEKPFQKELMVELLERIRSDKLHIIRDIIEGDLGEVDRCLKAKCYKSALVLSGSVLEAIILDWISEVSKVDYLHSNESIDLYNAIEQLNKNNNLTVYLKNAAHRIRKKRNLVHPKLYLKLKDELDEQVATEILTDLRKILSKRLKEY